jgi:hypothetical protein
MQLTGTLLRRVAVPVRAGLSASELALTAALGVVRATRHLLGRDGFAAGSGERWVPGRRQRSGRSSVTDSAPSPQADVEVPPPAPRTVSPPPPVTPALVAGPAVPASPSPRGAKRVDDEPVPVAEFGEEGTDGAAGAEVRVQPPWEGYDGMTAAEIQRTLGDAERETVAAVALYEQRRRARKSVVGAADRRLRALDV